MWTKIRAKEGMNPICAEVSTALCRTNVVSVNTEGFGSAHNFTDRMQIATLNAFFNSYELAFGTLLEALLPGLSAIRRLQPSCETMRQAICPCGSKWG